MASGDAFHRAYTNATQQALLEGHELAFDYFGGVFRTLRYDNMTSLAKKIPPRPAASGDRPDHRIPFALGRVLHPGQGQRKGRRGRRVGLVPAQLSGAGAGWRL